MLCTPSSIPAYNVQNASIKENPADFAKVKLDLENQSLILEVNEPLWSKNNPDPPKSYIDVKRVREIEIVVEMTCKDGQSKEVIFRVPIIDENTQQPRFEKSEYDLKTEPCISERCVFAFDSEILLIDEDRDEENAQVMISTDSDLIELLTNVITVEKWYEHNSDLSTYAGYKMKMKLAFTPKSLKNMSLEKSISFNIMAENLRSNANGTARVATSKIIVTFEEWPDRLLPPIFSSPFYYAQVEYFGQILDVQPPILATVPWDDGTNSISYKFLGQPDVFYMNPDSGQITLKNEFDESALEAIKKGKVNFTIRAERRKKIEGGEGDSLYCTSSSTALFVVIFSNLTEPPICLPECNSTPWPGKIFTMTDNGLTIVSVMGKVI